MRGRAMDVVKSSRRKQALYRKLDMRLNAERRALRVTGRWREGWLSDRTLEFAQDARHGTGHYVDRWTLDARWIGNGNFTCLNVL